MGCAVVSIVACEGALERRGLSPVETASHEMTHLWEAARWMRLCLIHPTVKSGFCVSPKKLKNGSLVWRLS